jgi:TolA-binding protein
MKKVKNLKKIVLFGVIGISSFLSAYEPSVYGAGDIDSATPYGLTQTEQAVLDNKKTLQSLYNKMTKQQRKIDGLTTIVNGQNREILDLKEQVVVLEKRPIPVPEDKNQTYSLLLELGKMIDNINNTYVSRDELEKILAGSRPEEVISHSGSSLGSPVVNNTTESNSADTYRKGVQLFAQRSYNAAKEHFKQALAENYKPASSNYYLGEASYYTHNYKDAVAYYKQSASLHDQASYMAVLYLHTAISLDESGEKEQAKAFYQHVIDNYPNEKVASIAKNRM